MWQRIASSICSCAGLALILAASTSVSAQEASVVTSPAITAAPAPEQVRFISFDKITHVRLEVFSPAGERLFDSGFKSGDLLDWGLGDQQGQRLTDGSYLCVVTVKDLSGRLSQRHGLVSLREREVLLQRVASEELPTGASRAWADSRATLGAAQDSGDLSFIGEDAPATMTVTAHDGRDGQVTSTTGSLTFRTGDVLSGNDKEHVRVTPEGRVGIGTTDPQATLDVAGSVRAQDGIVFGDGTVLKSARDLKYTEIVGVNPNATRGTPTLNATGSGTAGRISKWLDNVGTLGDSVITESGGKIGIGTTNPGFGLHLVGGSLVVEGTPGFNFGNADFAVRSASGNGFWDFAVSNTNGSFLMFDAVGSKTPLSIEQGAPSNSLYVSKIGGNVGIGTSSPSTPLEVVYNNDNIGFGFNIRNTNTGSQALVGHSISSAAGSRVAQLVYVPPTYSDVNMRDTLLLGTVGPATRIGIATSGAGGAADIFFRAGGGNPNRLLIHGATGNVGVGTDVPAQRLDVVGNVKVTGAGNGIIFPDGSVQTTAAAQGPAGNTSAICTSAIAQDGICRNRTCSCPNGYVAVVLSPCTVTSDTGTCSAGSCQLNGNNFSSGQCCVCKP